MTKVKKTIALLLIAGFGGFMACEKDEVVSSEEELVESNVNYRLRGKITIRFSVGKGTRKQADKIRDLGRMPDGTCHGRSFCVGGIANGEIIWGEVEHAPESFTPDDVFYAFSLSKEDDAYEFKVSPEDILPEVSEEIFEDNVFIMDANYPFPLWACEEFGVEDCILPAGTYPVEEDEMGNIFFNFY